MFESRDYGIVIRGMSHSRRYVTLLSKTHGRIECFIRKPGSVWAGGFYSYVFPELMVTKYVVLKDVKLEYMPIDVARTYLSWMHSILDLLDILLQPAQSVPEVISFMKYSYVVFLRVKKSEDIQVLKYACTIKLLSLFGLSGAGILEKYLHFFDSLMHSLVDPSGSGKVDLCADDLRDLMTEARAVIEQDLAAYPKVRLRVVKSLEFFYKGNV